MTFWEMIANMFENFMGFLLVVICTPLGWIGLILMSIIVRNLR